MKPVWNYVITLRGEILVGAEDFGWIKHTSLSGGQDVWAAGEIGFDGGMLRLVNLHSGHYVGLGSPSVLPGSPEAVNLARFVEGIIRRYYQAFGLTNLDPGFACIWS